MRILRSSEFINENLNEIQREILDEIKAIQIDCPECKYIGDDQYTCTTCWYQGGDGRINVLNWIKEHKNILQN